jgi:hypothetical protein
MLDTGDVPGVSGANAMPAVTEQIGLPVPTP